MDVENSIPQNSQHCAPMKYDYYQEIWGNQRKRTKIIWKIGENHCMKQIREAMNFQYQQKSTSLFVQFMK